MDPLIPKGFKPARGTLSYQYMVKYMGGEKFRFTIGIIIIDNGWAKMGKAKGRTCNFPWNIA